MNKHKKIDKKIFRYIEVVTLTLLTCIISLGFGYYLGIHKTKVEEPEKDTHIEKFTSNYQYIIDNYYGKVDKEALIDHAIKGMIESLGDDYSTFMNGSESNTFDIMLKGQYEGLGISVGKIEDTLYIVNVYEDSPASKAGLKALDIIKKVNGKDGKDYTTDEVTKIIQKAKGNIELLIDRDGEEIKASLQKGKIVLKSVSSKMIDEEAKIGYIKIDIFALNTASQFTKALGKLEKEGMESLIIDVRSNGGGHLSTAQEISSSFVDASHVIYQTEVKGKKTKTYSTGKTTKEYPIIFLTNKDSASGSELLVAALKETIGARSVGKTTFGKGTVQELVPLTTGSEYKVTVKKWLTPKGNWINKKGIEPDVDIELDEAYLQEPSEEKDNQLNKALEMLK